MYNAKPSKNDGKHDEHILSEQEAVRMLSEYPVSVRDIVEFAKKKRSFSEDEIEQIERILEKQKL